MRLSDVMSAMQMSRYAEVALLLFMAAFVVVALQLVGRSRQREWDSARRLPLDDDAGESDPTRQK